VRLSLKTGDRLWIGIGVVWLLAVAAGMRIMQKYELTAGAPGDPPTRWPAESRLPRKTGLPTIVVIAHPKCPCTRATIGELAIIMTRLHNSASADIVFVRPQGTPNDWDDTDLRRSAAAIPGVTVSSDLNEVEASLFGAQVSGQTMLYDAAGKLEFSGGITASRGHAGDNLGRSSIVSFVTTGSADHTRTPVFGCALSAPKPMNGATL
jgi:hypothetical protein